MSWQKIDVTGGVVRTRAKRSLAPGEWYQLTNVRLKPGDNEQIHNDVGSQSFGSPNNTVVAGPFYLSFEGSDNKLLVVTTDGSSSSYIETATVGTTGTFSSIQTITGVVTQAWVVHRGDQYFVGTDQGNYVVQDNVSRGMGMETTVTFAEGALTGSGSPFVEDDAATYVLAEYDSTNDIEGAGRGLTVDGFNAFVWLWGSGDDGKYPNITWVAANKSNSNADKMRIYREFYGNIGTTERAYIQNEYNNKTRVFQGAFLEEVDITDEQFFDDGSGKYSGATPYPLVVLDTTTAKALYYMFQQPEAGGIGCLFNDSVVATDPGTSKQIVRYSPPGYPEYQPTPYFMYFATDRSDEVVGLRVINNRLVVLTTGGIHRVNYLPFAGDLSAQQGRVQEPITTGSGCRGRWGHTKVETEQGEYVVWLSKRGLEWSNGLGWSDACPDFDGALVASDDAVLINNRGLYRLELYDGAGSRWDFYYHPSHLKNGRLKLIGPHSAATSSAVKGACSNDDYLWVADASSVYVVNVDNSAADSVMESGHIAAGPFSDVEVMGCGMTHSGTANTTYKAKVYGKCLGETEQVSIERTMPDGDQDETGKAEVAMSGKYARLYWTVSGSGAWAAGPSWVDVKVTGGGQ